MLYETWAINGKYEFYGDVIELLKKHGIKILPLDDKDKPFCVGWQNGYLIRIDFERSITQRIVILFHEVGHLIDFKKNDTAYYKTLKYFSDYGMYPAELKAPGSGVFNTSVKSEDSADIKGLRLLKWFAKNRKYNSLKKEK